jgi:hypothetical protein
MPKLGHGFRRRRRLLRQPLERVKPLGKPQVILPPEVRYRPGQKPEIWFPTRDATPEELLEMYPLALDLPVASPAKPRKRRRIDL